MIEPEVGADGLKDSILKAIYTESTQSSLSRSENCLDDVMATPVTAAGSLGDIRKIDTSLSLNRNLAVSSESLSRYPLRKLDRNESNKTEKRNSSFVRDIDRTTSVAWVTAVRGGQIKKCEDMLKEQPDLLHFVPPFHHNYNCVHIATRARHHALLRALHARGADFEAQTMAGYTPLHLAAQSNDLDTIHVLRSLGVDETKLDFAGHPYRYYLPSLDKDLDCSVVMREKTSSRSRPVSTVSLDSLGSEPLARTESKRKRILGLLRVPMLRRGASRETLDFN